MKEQYHPKYAKKQNVRLPLSAYLSYLLIATLLLTGVSFSKYATTGSADDGARVALVMLDGSGSGETDLSLGDGTASASYEFTIENYNVNGVSEVSLNYTITVTMPEGKALPKGVDVTLTYTGLSAEDLNGTPRPETTNVACQLVSSDDEVASGVYTFAGGAIFDTGKYTWLKHYYELAFTVTDESQITEDSSFTGIEISVKAEQID